MEEIREVCKAALQKCNDKKKNDWSTKKSIIRDALRDFLYENQEKADDSANNHGSVKVF